jgi:hypothetical protein
VRIKPRRRQFLNARVTVVRDVLARPARSSCDSGIAMWISPFVPLPCRPASWSRSPASRCVPVVTESVLSISAASPQRWIITRT